MGDRENGVQHIEGITSLIEEYERGEGDPGGNVDIDRMLGETHSSVFGELSMSQRELEWEGIFAVEGYIIQELRLLGVDLNEVFPVAVDGTIDVVLPDFDSYVPQYPGLCRYELGRATERILRNMGVYDDLDMEVFLQEFPLGSAEMLRELFRLFGEVEETSMYDGEIVEDFDDLISLMRVNDSL